MQLSAHLVVRVQAFTDHTHTPHSEELCFIRVERRFDPMLSRDRFWFWVKVVFGVMGSPPCYRVYSYTVTVTVVTVFLKKFVNFLGILLVTIWWYKFHRITR